MALPTAKVYCMSGWLSIRQEKFAAFASGAARPVGHIDKAQGGMRRLRGRAMAALGMARAHWAGRVGRGGCAAESGVATVTAMLRYAEVTSHKARMPGAKWAKMRRMRGKYMRS